MTTADQLLNAWTANIQSLRLWVMQLVAWLADMSGLREMRLMAQEDLRQIRRDLRVMLVMRVAIELRAGRFAPPIYWKTRKTPAIDNALPRRRFMRHALRGVHIRSFDDARFMLDNIEKYVAMVAHNLRHGVIERVLHWSGVAVARVSAVRERPGAADTS